MPMFRKRPVVVVEARQWDGSEESQREIVNWSGGSVSGWTSKSSPSGYCLRVGDSEAHPGWWIIRCAEGGFHPCKPTIFHATYEKWEEEAVA